MPRKDIEHSRALGKLTQLKSSVTGLTFAYLLMLREVVFFSS